MNGHEGHVQLSDRALLEAVHAKVCRLEEFIEGPNDARERGLVVRVDRLEQAEQRRNFWTTTAVGGAVAALITAIATWIGK